MLPKQQNFYRKNFKKHCVRVHNGEKEVYLLDKLLQIQTLHIIFVSYQI